MAVSISGGVAVVGAWSDDDAGTSSGSTYVFALECDFVRGDCNVDGVITVADPVYNLEYLFENGPSECLDAQDSNDDGTLDISDPIYNLGYQFNMGPPPPAPFPACGVDPTDDGLDCSDYSCL